MRRRSFLGQFASAGALLASSAVLDARLLPPALASPGPVPPIGRPEAPSGSGTIRYLTADPAYQDGRPCFDPTGTLVLFMRTPIGQASQSNPPSSFYTVPVSKGTPWPILGATPDLFFRDSSVQATRPDWSWSRSSYEIAFSGNSNQIYLLDVKSSPKSRKPLLVECQVPTTVTTGSLSYPAWTRDGTQIVLTNYAKDPGEQLLLRALGVPDSPARDKPLRLTCEAVTDPQQVWPGMSSVSPVNSDLVAFAGQGPNVVKIYDQNWNQIWVQDGSNPPQQVNGIQGRAPWWDPLGKRIAYESILTSADGFNPFFRIWVMAYPPTPGAPPGGTMVTPSGLAVQHAKWSPNGQRIVFAYNIPWAAPVNGSAPQGIAVVDVPTGP